MQSVWVKWKHSRLEHWELTINDVQDVQGEISKSLGYQSCEARDEEHGFNENELQVTVEPNRLTISGKRETSKEEKKGKTVYSEKCSNEIFRVVDLPAEVDTNRVTANLKNGTLELTMPKTQKAQAVPIRPQAAA